MVMAVASFLTSAMPEIAGTVPVSGVTERRRDGNSPVWHASGPSMEGYPIMETASSASFSMRNGGERYILATRLRSFETASCTVRSGTWLHLWLLPLEFFRDDGNNHRKW